MAATVTVRCLDAEGALETCSLDELGARSGDAIVWIDITDPDERTMETIATRFGLHPLAVEDVLHPQFRPKVDQYEDATAFIVWLVPRALNGKPASDGSTLETDEIDIFFGKDFLVTVRRGPVPALDAVIATAVDTMRHGPAWVIHAVLDRSVDSVFPLLDDLSDRLDTIEDRMLDSAPSRADLTELYSVKRLLLGLRRVIAPERDIIRELPRNEALVSSRAFRYFQDVGDHLARAEDAIETYRDIAASAADIYLSSVSNRLNEVMKRLTLVATIFMPLTFLTGIYGMNFVYMPPKEWFWGFPVMMGFMLGVVVSMLVWFRRQKWM